MPGTLAHPSLLSGLGSILSLYPKSLNQKQKRNYKIEFGSYIDDIENQRSDFESVGIDIYSAIDPEFKSLQKYIMTKTETSIKKIEKLKTSYANLSADVIGTKWYKEFGDELSIAEKELYEAIASAKIEALKLVIEEKKAQLNRPTQSGGKKLNDRVDEILNDDQVAELQR